MSDVYPITVKFKNDSGNTYLLNGKLHLEDSRPDLYWTERHIIDEPDPEPERLPDLEVDTKVLVRNCDVVPWVRRYFAGWTKDGKIRCFNDGTTSWTHSNTTEWKLWKLPDNEED